MEVMITDDYLRAVDLRPIAGSRLPAGRDVAHDELDALLAARDTDDRPAEIRGGAVIALAYLSGLRRGELVALRLGDVDVSARPSPHLRRRPSRRRRRSARRAATARPPRHRDMTVEATGPAGRRPRDSTSWSPRPHRRWTKSRQGWRAFRRVVRTSHGHLPSGQRLPAERSHIRVPLGLRHVAPALRSNPRPVFRSSPLHRRSYRPLNRRPTGSPRILVASGTAPVKSE